MVLVVLVVVAPSCHTQYMSSLVINDKCRRKIITSLDEDKMDMFRGSAGTALCYSNWGEVNE